MTKCRHSHPETPELPELTERLRAEALKVTGPRHAILKVLRAHPHPMTHREIHGELAGDRCDLATIYRAMHLLVKMGMVKKYNFGDGSARFELVTEARSVHHHHLVCTACSIVVEIEECFPAALEKQIAEQNGFSHVSHSLEFFGICPDCQKAARPLAST